MAILIHIIIALASIAFTTYLYFAPSKAKLYAAYGLVAMTIGSGTYLIISKPSHLMSACAMGLLYLAVVSVGIIAAKRKLAASEVE